LSKRRERFLSVAGLVAILGMAFGVASLLIALSVISGFQKEYKRAVLGFNSHLILLSADEIDHPEEEMERIFATVPDRRSEVVGWTPFIYREGMVVSGSKVKGIVLKGVDFERYSNLSRMRISFEKDSNEDALNPEKLPTVILGRDLARELDPKVRAIRVLFPQGLKPEAAGAKNVRQFFVGGTFESGMYEYDSSFVFISLPEAERFFRTGGKVSGIEIWLKNPDDAEAWAERLKERFEYPYVVMTWRELNENIFRALELEKVVFFVLMIVLIAVACLNVLGTLLMLLLEKGGAVAILRAVGLSWRRLRKVFLFDGLLIGFLGVSLGILLGLGVLFFLEHWQPIELAPEVYFVRKVPVVYSWKNFFWVVSSAFLVIFVGCELALRGIARVNVLRALQES
jgi:lipoprotein-releasing system permease protein